MGKSIIKRIFEVLLLTWLLVGSAALIYLLGSFLLVMGDENLDRIYGFTRQWEFIIFNGLITYYVLPLPIFGVLAVMVLGFLYWRKSAVGWQSFFAWLAGIIVVLLYLGWIVFTISVTVIGITVS
jgi:hypothetical protein